MKLNLETANDDEYVSLVVRAGGEIEKYESTFLDSEVEDNSEIAKEYLVEMFGQIELDTHGECIITPFSCGEQYDLREQSAASILNNAFSKLIDRGIDVGKMHKNMEMEVHGEIEYLVFCIDSI